MHRVSLQEKELSCPVCIDIFDEPKALPECAHNVCEKCLHGIAARNGYTSVTCPVCRLESYLPPGGVARLPTNHFMKTVVQGLPGRQEVQSIKKAVELCEKDLTSSKSHLGECDRLITTLKTAQLNAQRIKKQISDHAEYLIDLVQNQRVALTAEVDQRDEIINSLLSNLRKEKKTASLNVKESEKILAEANGLIEQGNVQEIIDKKDQLVSKLEEKTSILSTNRIFISEVPENIHFIKASEFRTGREIFGYLRRDSVKSDHDIDEHTCDAEYEGWGSFPSLANPLRKVMVRSRHFTLSPGSRRNYTMFETTTSDYMQVIQPTSGYRHPIFNPLPEPPFTPRPPYRRLLQPQTPSGQW